jgi:Skp family chaperone for outer membrane proteins
MSRPGLFVLLVLLVFQPARAELKIGYVDTEKAFAAYYKTDEMAEKIAAKSVRFQKEIHDLQLEYQQAANEAEGLELAAKNPRNSPAVRKSKDAVLAEKVKDLQSLDDEIGRMQRSRTQEVKDELSRSHQEIYEEIVKAIVAYVGPQGYDLVLDKTSYAQGESMLFASAQVVDLTPTIILRLNSTHHTR